MEEKWRHCHMNEFTGIINKEINCVILNLSFWKKINCALHQLVYPETKTKQRMPNNVGVKKFHCFF